MSTTYLQLHDRILRMLGDPEGTGYSDDLVWDAVRVAHEAILPWVPKLATSSLTGDGSATAFTLPADIYSVDSVCVNSTGELLAQAVLSPGKTWGEYIASTNNWLEYPSGSLTFAKALAGGEVYDLFYLAYWNTPQAPTDNTFILEPPTYSHYGISLYAAAYCLVPQAANAAEMRQWLTRVDAGSPEHNPMMKAANWLLSLFQSEMSRHPKYQKVQR